MFPDGFPGLALFLLRLSVIGMLVDSTFQNTSIREAISWELAALLFISLLLLCGAFTPIASGLSIILQAICWPGWSEIRSFEFCLQALVMVALFFLGPGAYSIDAKMFGRRLILPPE
jgi:hypothetical protein